jgi:tripartite-type tricarboxylate transporter receptor subunit TctC
MQEMVEKLKSIKNATQSQYDEVIQKYSHTQVIEDLKKAGISKSELSDEEFQELLNEQVVKSKSFSKGAMVATGALLFLELLG